MQLQTFNWVSFSFSLLSWLVLLVKTVFQMLRCQTLVDHLIKFLTKFLQNSYKIHTEFLQISYKFLTKFLQNSYKILTKFLQNSYKILTNFLQNSCETIILAVIC